MYNMITAEFYKIKKSTSFKVLFIILFCAGLLMVMLSKGLTAALTDMNNGEAFLQTGSETFYQAITDSGLYLIFGAIFASLYIGAEFEHRTLQNALTGGVSRITFLAAKAVGFYAALFLLMLPYMFTFTAGTTLLYGFGMELSLAAAGNMLLTFLTCYASYASLTGLVILLAFLLKKTGAVVALGLCIFILIPSILEMIAMIFPAMKKLLALTPLGLDAQLLKAGAPGSYYAGRLLIAAIWLILLLLASYGVFRRDELK